MKVSARRRVKSAGPRQSDVRSGGEHLRSNVRAQALRCGPGDGACGEARGTDRHGDWIPNDPTLVAQILKISSSYSPPPPEGFISPMTWGVESHVLERFGSAGIPVARIAFARDTYTFNFGGTPSEFVAAFRQYCGPRMNAFDAAEKNGRAGDLLEELEALFNSQTGARDRISLAFRPPSCA